MLLDIFNDDPFSAISLTVSIQNSEYVPQFLGGLNLFGGMPSYTNTIAIEEENGTLSVIATSPRGAPPEQSKNTKRTMRHISTVRLAREAVIYADQVAGIRALGTDNELQTAEQVVKSRIDGPFGLRAEMELTHEYHRLGAIDGAVYDADGVTKLWDFYTLFGVSRPSVTNFDFGAMTADGSTFHQACTTLLRAIVKELQGMPLANMRPVVLCGDNFYDGAYHNKEVKSARVAGETGKTSAVEVISKNGAYSSFDYGGFTWVNYRGTADGKVGIGTNDARLFPYGVPGLFQTHFGFADFDPFINTAGLPVYLLQPKNRQTERARVFEIQSNPLHLCVKPKSLRRLLRTA